MKNYTKILLAISAVALAACSNVQPGHVGIKVDKLGTNAGVSTKALGVGMYFTGPWTSVYEYPVYTSTYAWTAGNTEGSKTNESFDFQDTGGVGLNADIAVSYHVDPTKAPTLFQTYRTDMQGIVDGTLRSAVRNAIVDRAATMQVDQIVGPKKVELINNAFKDVNAKFQPLGLVVDQLYWASNIRMPKQINEQITLRVANEQAALAAQASVATSTALGQQRVAAAEANAKAIQVEAAAVAANPQIIPLKTVEKWDGHFPTYVAGNMPLPTISVK